MITKAPDFLNPPKVYVDGDMKQMFADVVYIVETTSFERQALWEFWVQNNKRVRSWEGPGSTPLLTLGTLGDRPICALFHRYKINGKLVIMWEATSSLVDLKLIEEFIEHHAKGIHTCDAMNFGNCVNYLEYVR